MPKLTITLSLVGWLLCVTGSSYSQVTTRTDILQNAAVQQAAKEKKLYETLARLSKEKGWPLVIENKDGGMAILSGIDPLGYPIYLSTDNNIAASSIRTNRLWPGGSTGLNLSGASNALKGKIAIWDGGRIRSTHVELAGKIIQKDNFTGALSDHSTHVAGTMVAKGINTIARGMAFGAQDLLAYDFSSHLSEMLTESPNLLISNHSYGAIAGWRFNSTDNRWEFWGQANTFEDYKFGYYSEEAEIWDSIAYNAPYYMIVKSVGNNRDENGPAVGQPYWRFNTSNQMSNAGNRPAGISSNNSYDCVSTYGTAKNVLTVGAVEPLVSGYSQATDVVMTSFSSWGPTDDGRIKPDVVANGVDLFSSVTATDNSYAYNTGTSMCTPSASGSLFLLQELYSNLNAGAFIRSATLKGIVIHTADEAGTGAGPDYQFGWGLINMEKAAAVIASGNTDKLIQENTLSNGGTFSLPVVASGKGNLVVTVCWTDPKAVADKVNLLNNPALRLINDLDVRVKKGAATYSPWVLNPANPAASATKADNIRDNVEKIEITDAVPGETYTIEITHKGTLQRGAQAYSLIVSGVGGTAYCASGATTTAGARIDSISFGTLQKANPAGCTDYTNNKNLTAGVEANSTVPIFVRVSSCDASSTDKIVKAFIDFNNDGDFTDAGELVATSGVISGNGDFSGTATIPAGLSVGNYSVLRIVVQQTSSAASVTPCGTFANGETQDYRVVVSNPSSDLGVTEVISPFSNDCATPNTYVTVRIKNFGATAKSNIDLLGTVMEGTTTIATLTGKYPGTIAAFAEAIYTFQAPFVTEAGKTYNITVKTDLPGDQNTANDQLVSPSVIFATGAGPAGQAELCGANQVFFKTTATDFDVFYWYDSPTATTPIATGATASSNVITGNQTYYLARNDQVLKAGPANKLVYPNGGYNAFTGNYVRLNINAPLILESARLYIGAPGKVKFTVGRVASTDASGNPETYNLISEVTLDVYKTHPGTTTPGAQNNDPADAGAVYYLGLVVPTTGDHIIIINCTEGATIFRNNMLTATPYPMTVPGVLSFTGNSAPTPGEFYYFFYDMNVRLANCPSGRTAIVASTATAPTININGSTLSSSSPTSNQWYLNNNIIPGAIGQQHNAIASGKYKVVVTDNFGCALSSNELDVTVTGVPNIDPTAIGLRTMPNPNNGRFTIDFTVNTRSDMQISMTNMVGQEVYRKLYPGFVGHFNEEMHLNKLSPGVYLLKVYHDKKNYLKKIIIK